jgi:hypothetical protein
MSGEVLKIPRNRLNPLELTSWIRKSQFPQVTSAQFPSLFDFFIFGSTSPNSFITSFTQLLNSTITFSSSSPLSTVS